MCLLYHKLLLFTHLVTSNSLQPHELHHARSPCPSLPPKVCSSSCPLSWWCHPAISSITQVRKWLFPGLHGLVSDRKRNWQKEMIAKNLKERWNTRKLWMWRISREIGLVLLEKEIWCVFLFEWLPYQVLHQFCLGLCCCNKNIRDGVA